MKKAYKCALVADQMEKMLQMIEDNDNLVEIQLLSVNDDLSLIDCFRDRICTIHLPMELEDRTCNLSTVIKACGEKKDKYVFLCKVAAYAIGEDCGIVIHTDIPIEEMCKAPEYKSFIEWIKSYGIKLYLENTFEIKDSRKSLLVPVMTSYKINKDLENKLARPLLDICHFQISYNQYDSNLKQNLRTLINNYSSDKTIIHFATAIGNGDSHNGGTHGSNFSENPDLLIALLKDLKKRNPILVLETEETDMVNKPNAKALNDKIDEIMKTLDVSDFEKIKK